PTAIPIPAAPQIIAAVVKPEIRSLSLLKMTPAPRNPIPDTIWAARRSGSILISVASLPGNTYADSMDTIVIKQLIMEVTRLIFKPSGFFFTSRSIPIIKPKMADIISFTINSTSIDNSSMLNPPIFHIVYGEWFLYMHHILYDDIML